MRKKLLILACLSLLCMPLTASAATWNEVFSMTGKFKNGYLSGSGTALNEATFAELTSPSNFYVLNGKQKINVGSVMVTHYSSADGNAVPKEVFLYKGKNANSGFITSVYTDENSVLQAQSLKGPTIKIFREKLNLNSIETSGTVEMDTKVPPGKGIRYVYTTDWNDDFNQLEKKLVKVISQSFDSSDKRIVTLSYTPGSKNYAQCVKNLKTPFCFKKEGNKLVFSSRSDLGQKTTFWVKGPVTKTSNTGCGNDTTKYENSKDGYTFCYNKNGKVAFIDNEVQFAASKDEDYNGSIYLTIFNGTLSEYVNQLDGVVSDSLSFTNKNGLAGMQYYHAAGGWGGNEVIFKKPGTNTLVVIMLNSENKTFLSTIKDSFSFTQK